MLDKVNGCRAHRAAEEIMNIYLDELLARMLVSHEGE